MVCFILCAISWLHHTHGAHWHLSMFICLRYNVGREGICCNFTWMSHSIWVQKKLKIEVIACNEMRSSFAILLVIHVDWTRIYFVCMFCGLRSLFDYIILNFVFVEVIRFEKYYEIVSFNVDMQHLWPWTCDAVNVNWSYQIDLLSIM